MPNNDHARLYGSHGVLVLESGYVHDFISEMKHTIPASDRKWNAEDKVWEFSPRQFGALVTMLTRHYSFPRIEESAKSLGTAKIAPQKMTIQIDYLGRVKHSGFATGYVAGEWKVRISEKVLRAWFSPFDPVDDDANTNTPKARSQTVPSNYYTVLGIQQTATIDEIKSAWRRGLKTWHPDICQEPDARQWFDAVQSAYAILSTPEQRVKYNAGLLFAEKTEKKKDGFKTYKPPKGYADLSADYIGYAPPIRCGIVTCDALPGAYLEIVKVYDWKDIQRTNKAGDTEIKVAYWNTAEKIPDERWVEL